MRPPMQSAALQQNENLRNPSAHYHQQQQQHSERRQPIVKPAVSYFVTPLQQAQHSGISDSIVSGADSVKVGSSLRFPPATRTFSYSNSDSSRQRSSHDRRGDTIIDINKIEDDSIQLVDLSTSPPNEAISLQPATHHKDDSLQHNNRSSIAHSEFIYSRSSSSDGEEASYSSSGGSRSGGICVRSSTFDDEIAENFIINYPAEDTSPSHRNQSDCGINLPLSETEPLLTNIDIPDKQRSICLSKNSASLIFTKKDIQPSSRFFTSFTGGPSKSLTNNNKPEQKQKRLHHSFRSSNEHVTGSGYASSQRRKSATKHLPATYHQQQRRSLQLNYNINLVTTSTCSANNNYCCNNGCAIDQSGVSTLQKPLHHHQRQTLIGLSVEAKTPAGNKQAVAVVTGTPTAASTLTTTAATTTTAAVTRKQNAYSWYAPVYTALEEELEQESRDSSPIHNLANTKKHHSAIAAGAIQYTQHHRSSRNSSLSSGTEAVGDNETVALLETRNQINIQAQAHLQSVNIGAKESINGGNDGGGIGGVQHLKRNTNTTNSGHVLPTTLSLSSNENIVSYDVEGSNPGSLGLTGGPLPRRRRFENFLKSLVGLKSSASNAMNTGTGGGRNNSHGNINGADVVPTAINASTVTQPRRQLPTSPEITITRTPSEQNMVVLREPAGRCQQKNQQHQTKLQRHRRSSDRLGGNSMISTQGSTSSLNVVQQKLWNMLRREGSASSLHHEKSHSVVQYTGLRKCETVLALTRQTNSLYSPVLDTGSGDGEDAQIAGGDARFTTMNNRLVHSTRSGIFNANGVEQIRPLNRLRNSMTSMNATCSRCSSLLSLAATGSRYSLNISGNSVGSFVSTIPSGGGPAHNSSHSNLRAINREFSDGGLVIKQERNQQQNHSGLRKTSGGAQLAMHNPCGSSPSSGTLGNLNPSIANSTSSTIVNKLSPSTPTTLAAFPSPLTPSSTPTTAPTTVTNTTTSPTAIVTTSNTISSASTSSITSSCAASSSIASQPTTDPTYPLTVTSLLTTTHDGKPILPDVTDANAAQLATRTSSSIPISPESNTTPNYDTSQCWLSTYQMGAPPGGAQSVSATTTVEQPTQPFEMFTCKLCLIAVETAEEATTLHQCNCQFCTECMRAYVEFEISEGAHEISCPDAQCPSQGIMTLPEIANLTTANLMKKHHRYRLNREIELDKTRTWCPRAGCETVCMVGGSGSGSGTLHSDAAPSTSTTAKSVVIASPTGDGIAQFICAVHCPSCREEFCSACKKSWHPNISCEENSRRLVADGQDDIGIPFDNELIKCCPMCAVPIEKDEGCAQMMCKRCKHVFCWYCLASLDDDFLLRHYDKGPCKNKLGHSRASVVWHRAQVIGIFAGFGILLLVASPLLLLAAPCIICCKCRSCSGSKIDEGDGELDEATALQS